MYTACRGEEIGLMFHLVLVMFQSPLRSYDLDHCRVGDFSTLFLIQINLNGNRVMSIPASWSQMIFLKVRLLPCPWVQLEEPPCNRVQVAKTIEYESGLVQNDTILHAIWKLQVPYL